MNRQTKFQDEAEGMDKVKRILEGKGTGGHGHWGPWAMDRIRLSPWTGGREDGIR